MRQAWHIFRKDVRGMRAEIGLLIALAIVLGWAETSLTDPSWLELTCLLAAIYAVARVIHFEAIPGTNQFWITRPYRRGSLLAAKVLFILICIQLPLFFAQLYMITANGFLLAQSLPGLLCSQALTLFLVLAPAACLASLTPGIVSFVLSGFLLVATVLFLDTGLSRVKLLAGLPAMQAGPDSIAWLRYSFAAAIVAVFAASVLFRQYRNRRTSANRKWGMAGISLACAIFLFMPWSVSLRLQAALSEQYFDGSSLRATLASVQKSVFPNHWSDPFGSYSTEVSLPLEIQGIPTGLDVATDALFVSLAGADAQTWSADFTPAILRPGEPGKILVDANLVIGRGFFEKENSRPVTLHARLYLTTFGNPRSRTVPIRQVPVNVIDGLQCGEGTSVGYTCRSIFRWPRRLVFAGATRSDEASVRSVSYSPFAADLGFGSIQRHSFSVPVGVTETTITTEEPVSHFLAELTIPNVLLTRYTWVAKHKCDEGLPGACSLPVIPLH